MKSRAGKIALGLLSVIVISGFVALGVWQVGWMQWQNRLVEQGKTVAASEPATLTDIEAGLEYGFDVNVLRVRLNGFYRHDLERYITAPKDGARGFQVITPFIEDLGYVVLVDRGWVSEADRDPQTRANPRRPEGKISVTGITRLNIISQFSLRDAPDRRNNIWSWYDRTGLARSLPDGLGDTDGQAGLYAQLFVQIEPGGEPGEGTSPRIDELKIQPGTLYLVFAVIFFLLAAALAAGTVRYFWNRRITK